MGAVGPASLAVPVGALAAVMVLAGEGWVLSRKQIAQIAATEAVSRLAGAEFNQAAVANPGPRCWPQAAASVSGPVGAAAEAMIEDAQTSGLEAAEGSLRTIYYLNGCRGLSAMFGFCRCQPRGADK